MLVVLGLGDWLDLGSLALAEDAQGTAWWVLSVGAQRYVGPVGAVAVDAFRDELLDWMPWTDPDWPASQQA